MSDRTQRAFAMPTALAVAGLGLAMVSARAGVESFEAVTVPGGWSPSAGSELAVAADRFKSGEKSLRRAWTRPDARVTCGTTNLFEPRGRTVGSLALWAYSEKFLQDILHLELLKEGAFVGKSWYVLSFSEWRPLGAPCAPTCPNPAQGVDGFRLIAHRGFAPGRLCLDDVNARCADGLLPDGQQPWVRQPERLADANPEKYI